MADFEMRNFLHFPIEKSSYDLKLELLEELDPKVALELIKANNGFRSIYLKDPWRIIGRHVHSIDFSRYRDTIEICKLGKSAPIFCGLLYHLPLLKKIRSCVKSDSNFSGYFRQTQQTIDTARKMLSNLDFIGKISIGGVGHFKEFFSIFKGQITDWISLGEAKDFQIEDDPTICKVFETQLRDCKQAVVNCRVEDFSIIGKLFSKTKIESINCYFGKTEEFSVTDVEMVIHWILCNGIPSQNRGASIWTYFPTAFHNFLKKRLSAFPGMQQMPDKDGRRYRRKVDDKRDCIYELDTYLKAFYVPSDAQ